MTKKTSSTLQISIIALLVVTLLKGIVTSIIVPLWEFPDEQAHFGQVSHYVEHGMKITHNRNVTREIYESEKIMGTLRDKSGKNNYTYNRFYVPEYSSTNIGPHEVLMNNFP